ncbi:MAG: molybdopterin-dependent oxidoreductase [Thermodesulfobacteriota bacterium]
MSAPVLTACTRHCGDGCSLLVQRRPDGSLSVRGNPDHPFTKGFLCAKTARFGERLDSPRRIVTPLIRQGGGFSEASWDEALGLIAAEISRLRPTPERMLHIFYYASFGLLHQASRLLFGSLGASGFKGSPCLSAGIAAQIKDFGQMRQGPLAQVESARRIVNWGRNAGAQSVHLSAIIAKARKKGARVLSIHPGDPGYGGLSDETIVIRPGTDRFLAAAALKLLVRRGHASMEALARCKDAEMFLEFLDGLPMDALLAACGADMGQVRLLEGHYGGAGPAATLIGRGLQRYASGGENVRYIDALAMLSGNVGRDGGGVYFCRPDQGQAAWNWAAARPGCSRSFPIADIAASVEAADPPVEFVWVEGMNLVTQCPDSEGIARMLESRFTVAVEPFMTDTARCATVILPPALMFECEDMVRNDAHQCVNHSAKAMEPRGTALPNFEIAARLGAMLSPPVAYPSPEAVMDRALREGKLSASLEQLRREGFLELAVPATPWADGVFAHPDGLYRLPEGLASEAEPDAAHPLRLLSPVRRDHLLSQIPEEEQLSPPRVYLSPESAALAELLAASPGADAAALSGPDSPEPGCFLPARLETALGSMEVRVGVLTGLHPEAVLYPRGDWLSRGGCVNRLIRPREADLGGQIAYYEERARLAAPPAV